MFGWAKWKAGLVPDHSAVDEKRTKGAVETVSNLKSQVDALQESLSEGSVVVRAGEDAYEETRRVAFYLHDAGYPAVIVKPKSAEDVAKIVKAAADQLSQLKLAVRCGAHTGFAMVDNALVCDLSLLSQISVDKDAKLATIGGGCKIEMVDKALEGTNLGFVTGTNGDTGVSGLTLAGGFGFLSRKHGFACDQVVTATIVLANGDIVQVSDQGEYADLMKALRGGGGNFGIVVEWTMKLHDASDCFGGLSVRLAPTMFASTASLKNWIKEMESLPSHSAAAAVLPGQAPVNVYLGVTYQEGAKDAKSWKDLEGLKYVANLGGWIEVQNNIKKRDHASDMQKLLEPMNQPSYTYTSAIALADIDDDLAGKLVALARQEAPTKQCVFIIFKMGGVGSQKEFSERSVLGHRTSKYWVVYEGGYTRYSDASTVEKVQAWMQTVKDTLMSSSGCDLPYAMWGTDQKPADSAEHQAYNAINKAYMSAMKAKYDPSNLFSLNKNVKPEQQATAVAK